MQKVKHYAVDKNIQHYTAVFKNTKVVKIPFDMNFPRKPMVSLTMADTGNVPVYRQRTNTNWVKIAFKTKWTGEVDVIVTER